MPINSAPAVVKMTCFPRLGRRKTNFSDRLSVLKWKMWKLCHHGVRPLNPTACRIVSANLWQSSSSPPCLWECDELRLSGTLSGNGWHLGICIECLLSSKAEQKTMGDDNLLWYHIYVNCRSSQVVRIATNYCWVWFSEIPELIGISSAVDNYIYASCTN